MVLASMPSFVRLAVRRSAVCAVSRSAAQAAGLLRCKPGFSCRWGWAGSGTAGPAQRMQAHPGRQHAASSRRSECSRISARWPRRSSCSPAGAGSALSQSTGAERGLSEGCVRAQPRPLSQRVATYNQRLVNEGDALAEEVGRQAQAHACRLPCRPPAGAGAQVKLLNADIASAQREASGPRGGG